MIGLVDYDLQTSTSIKLAPPNIEIMKLATYYQRETNTFCRLVGLNEQELSAYEKIYFFSEKQEQIMVPPQFNKASNVIFGGTCFTNEYQPFENSLIDFTLPKIFIYVDFLKQKINDGIQTSIINKFLNDTYYRNYAGKDKLPIPPIDKQKRVFLYDKDFFYDDWEETIQKISDKNPAQIVRIHPTICKKVSQYTKLREYPKFSRQNTLIFDFNIPYEEIRYFIKEYKNFLLADINSHTNVCLNLGGTLKSKSGYYNDFIYKINLLYSCWCQGIQLKLYYIPARVGFTDPLENLSRFFILWANGDKKQETFEEKFYKRKRKNRDVEEQEMNKLLILHPTAKNLFTQSYAELYRRRLWNI